MTYPVKCNKEENNKTVKMNIEGNKIIGELQHEFNGYFPFLHIEFYRRRSREEKTGIEKFNANQKLIFLNDSSCKITIHIDKNDKISSLKDQFNKHGIGVLIFRKAGSVWVETTLTEDWTLARQNMEGEIFSKK